MHIVPADPLTGSDQRSVPLGALIGRQVTIRTPEGEVFEGMVERCKYSSWDLMYAVGANLKTKLLVANQFELLANNPERGRKRRGGSRGVI